MDEERIKKRSLPLGKQEDMGPEKKQDKKAEVEQEAEV